MESAGVRYLRTSCWRIRNRKSERTNNECHFRNVFHFFSEKNPLCKTFLVECVWSGTVSCNKRREFWRETQTPLWLLIGRTTFLTCEKTSFVILIGHIMFFTCENHRSLPWLARTNLRTKIYDIAFWWVFLSMYIINKVELGVGQGDHGHPFFCVMCKNS